MILSSYCFFSAAVRMLCSALGSLANDPNAEHSILTAAEKKQYDERIIDYLKMIGDFYGYKPGIGNLLASGK